MHMQSSSQRLYALLALLLLLALPFSACDTADPSLPDPSEQPVGGGGDQDSEDNGNDTDQNEIDEDDWIEGELGGAFRVKVEPMNNLVGGVTADFGGSAVFFEDSESGRTVFALAHDDLLDAIYPFESIVFSTPDGRPEPGTYSLDLDFEASFMGGFVELRGADVVEVKLPFQDEEFLLPPSTIIQTFSGELVITESSAGAVTGSFTFRGFPVDSEYAPLYVRGESAAKGSFRAVSVSEDDAPDVDLDLYLPEDFVLP